MVKLHRKWFLKASSSFLVTFVCLPGIQAATINVPADRPTIQAGIDATIDGDTVLVADGVYTGPGNRDIDFSGRLIVLRSVNGPLSTSIDCEADSLNPHRAIIFYSGEDSTATLEGFTILSGYAPYGGGVKISSASPSIMNCIFELCSALDGGAIHAEFTGSLNIFDCLFLNNNSSNYGGAIYGFRTAINISDCTFEDNTSTTGGAFGGKSIWPKVRRTSFTRNSAALGGAVAVPDGALFEDCEFRENSASHGGAVYHSGFEWDPSGKFSRCVFADNFATQGSAMYRVGIFSENCLFIRNMGSAIYMGSAEYTNCTFYDNGDVFVLVEPYSAIPAVVNSIFAFNKGYVAECYRSSHSDIILGGMSLSHCNLYGNWGEFKVCIVNGVGLNGNFSVDPLFCDTANSNFGLKEESPCIGAGANGEDVGAFGVGCLRTGVAEEDIILPETFALFQNYPNPFNPNTTIRYSVPNKSLVTLQVFNVMGQRVATLVNGAKGSGEYTVTWNTSGVASGIYFYQLKSAEANITRKAMLLK